MCNIYETIWVRSVIGILNKAHKNLKFFILHVCGVLYVMQENSDLWKLKCMFFFLNFQTQVPLRNVLTLPLGWEFSFLIQLKIWLSVTVKTI